MPSIDSNKLKNSLRHLYEYENFPIADIELLIDHIPVMDMEPVRHGHWINKGYHAICSECGAISGTQYDGLEPIPKWSKFCPDCGAKMDGEK